MECHTFADVERLLRDIKERVEAVESFLQASLAEEAGVAPDATEKQETKEAKPNVLRKTKYGKLVETTTEKWLRGLLKKRPRVLYVETAFHKTCCLCHTEKYCLKMKTVKSGGERYTIPLCDECANALAQNPNSRKKIQNNLPRARIYYNAVETNRRKF